MRRTVLSCMLVLSLWAIAAEAKSIITIEVNESGNALWTAENYIPFTTQAELNEWEGFIQKGQVMPQYNRDIVEFRQRVNESLSMAENYSNRSMKAENLNISYDIAKTLPSAKGIIRYSFEWNNFSHVNLTNIYLGDAFSEDMILSSDNVLIIKIPESYEVQNATPSFDKRDGNRLIWDGTLHRNISKGEPFLVLNRTNVTNVTSQDHIEDLTGRDHVTLSLIAIVIFVIVLISIASVVFWKRKRSPNSITGKIEFYENLLMQAPREIMELLKIPGIWPKIMQFLHKELGIKSVEELEKAAREHRQKFYSTDSDEIDGDDTSIITPLPDMTKEILGYEDMIEQYLVKSGGQAYQSEIVKESRLSKSKISIVLAEMKEKGRILKIRKGKENIIRLANR